MKCIRCNKEFSKRSGNSVNKYCGLPCYRKWRKENPKPNNCKCAVCEKEFYLKPSSIKQGMGKYCSRDCKHYAQRERARIVGESYNDRHLLRQSTEYKTWRRHALKLHKMRCDKCGTRQHSICKYCGHKVYLHVHHIEKFATNIERRFDPTNSSVLCSKCHKGKWNNSGWIARNSRTDNLQPSQEIAKGFWKVRRSGLRKR